MPKNGSLSGPAVEVSGVSFSYRNYTSAAGYFPPVLSHVDFSLPQGAKMLILAPPDSGKTTLARILTGGIPRYFSGQLDGSVSIFGKPLEDSAPWDRLEVLSYAAHESSEELVATSCRDEIVFPLESLGLTREEMEKRLAQAAGQWGMTSFLDVGADEMSGGERRRLLLAVTRAIGAPLLILDEPFDDLDHLWRHRLLSYLNQPSLSVIVFASRPLDIWHGYFDTWALLSGGRLETGGEEEILERVSQEWGAFPSSVHFDSGRAAAIPPSHIPAADTREFVRTQGKHILETIDLSVRHERASSPQAFELSVPEFHISSGEVVALTGDNGAGKSTFCRILAGLDTPLTGRIGYDGGSDIRALRENIGFMFQNPDHQIFLPTVKEELSWSFSRMKGMSSQVIEEKVCRACALFRLDAEATPSTMSFGARKRLQAAVCWLLDRSFYVLDEPDASLTYADAFSLVRELGANGAGILIVSHDSSFVGRISSRIYHVSDGVVKEGVS